MRRFREWVLRLGGLFNKQRKDQELDEEIESHVRLHIEDNLRSGMTLEQARRDAMINLGGLELTKEAYRDQRGLPWIETIWQDVRYSIRQLLKNPSFTVVAIATLALGIGANAVIFGLIDALLLKSLPVQRPEQLMTVGTVVPGRSEQPYSSFSYPIYRAMEQKDVLFSSMFARSGRSMSMSGNGQTERVHGELVSGNFYSVLGVYPHLGQLFTEADDLTPGGHPVAVLSYNFWQRRFGADPSIVGKTINLNGYQFNVIGVSAKGFYGLEVGSAPDVRIPLMMDSQVRPTSAPPFLERRDYEWLAVMARLKPGVSIEQAQAAIDHSFQIAREPDVRRVIGESSDNRNFRSLRIQLSSAATGTSALSRQFSEPLFVLMASVVALLLIACLNVANLFLTRATARQKEIALRLALGAKRTRLVRQLLTEGLLLSGLGGLAGLLFTRWGTKVLLAFVPQGRTTTVLDIKPDLRMIGFSLGVTILSGLTFSLAPALMVTRPNLVPALKNEKAAVSGEGRRWELSRVLVTLQVGLSLVLLVGAGLFTRSLQNLKAVDTGYHSDQVVTMSLDPGQIGYKSEQLRTFFSDLRQRLAGLPGVKSTTYSRNAPISGSFSRYGIKVPGYQSSPGEEMAVLFNQVDEQFFATFGTTLLFGREFGRTDTPESPKVAIVNKSLAHYFFGDNNPLGKRITLEDYNDLEIVGVVADSKYQDLKEAPPKTAYIPYSQYTNTDPRVLGVRVTGDTAAIITAIRREVRGLDPNLPIFGIKTFAEQINESISRERLMALLSNFFGFFALLLAVLGLYGVVAQAVVRRTREIGIRVALGAKPGDILRSVLRETLLLALIGISIGFPVAFFGARLIKGLLFELVPEDPFIITMASLVMLSIAIVAGYFPARRAARVDPMVALRFE
jgi:predicted permease